MCGNRLKRWKTIPISWRCRAMFALLVLDELAVGCLAVADEVPVHEDPARLDLLEMVDAADERRLARAGRPDDDDHLLPLDRHRDALEDVRAVPNHFWTSVASTTTSLGGVGHAADRLEEVVGAISTISGPR